MTFYGYAYLSAQTTQTPDVTTDEIQHLMDIMKYLRKDQLKFIYALMVFNGAKEGSCPIGSGIPYGGVCLGSQISPSFAPESISPQMFKLIKLFIQEISK